MSFFKNRHLMLATLIAPVLAVISYFAVNALVGEEPHAAETGQSYRLVEKPNCRYSSGHCGLKNGDFELTLKAKWSDDGRFRLILKSEHSLDGVRVALVENKSDEQPPEDMQPMDEDGLTWSLDMARVDPEHDRLHLVASSNETLYFGDAALKFMADG